MQVKNINICIGVFLIVIGIVLLGVGLTLIPLIYKVFLGTSFVFGHYGEQPGFYSFVNGLLSGGYIMILPAWKIRLIALLGVLIAFVGVYHVVYREINFPLKKLLSKSYWSEFCPKIKYK